MYKSLFALLTLVAISFLVGFIYMVDSYNEQPVTSELFDNKDCSDEKFCYPQNKLLIRNIPFLESVEELDAFVKERNYFTSAFDVKRSEDGIKNSFYLKAKEHLKQNQTIFNFKVSNSITMDYLMSNNSFDSSFNQDKLAADIEISRKFKGNILVIGMIYHLLNYKQSKLSTWIKSLPKNLPPLYSKISQYEFTNFIAPEREFFSYFKKMIETHEKEFKELDYIFRKVLTGGERKSFFGEYKLNLADIAYFKWIIILSSVLNSGKIYSFPGMEFIRNNELYTPPEQISHFVTYNSDNEMLIRINLDQEIQANSIITRRTPYFRLYQKIIVFSEVPSASPFDCLNTEIVPRNFAFNLDYLTIKLIDKMFANKGIACLDRNPTNVEKYFILGNILNIPDSLQRKCAYYLLSTRDPEFALAMVNGICRPTHWKRHDLRGSVIANINNAKEAYSALANKTEEYIKLREKNGLSVELATILWKYYHARMDLSSAIITLFEALPIFGGPTGKTIAEMKNDEFYRNLEINEDLASNPNIGEHQQIGEEIEAKVKNTVITEL